jgi:hypothetical protein
VAELFTEKLTCDWRHDWTARRGLCVHNTRLVAVRVTMLGGGAYKCAAYGLVLIKVDHLTIVD